MAIKTTTKKHDSEFQNSHIHSLVHRHEYSLIGREIDRQIDIYEPKDKGIDKPTKTLQQTDRHANRQTQTLIIAH